MLPNNLVVDSIDRIIAISNAMAKSDLRDDPIQKIIWYTNSKTKAEESLVLAVENVLDILGIEVTPWLAPAALAYLKELSLWQRFVATKRT